MTLIQLIIISFVILILIKTVSDFKKKKFTLTVFLFWMIIWLAISIVTVHPQVTVFLANLLGVGRGTDVAIYFSILFIFFILFKIITKLEKTEQEITKIIRYLSFKAKDKDEDSLN